MSANVSHPSPHSSAQDAQHGRGVGRLTTAMRAARALRSNERVLRIGRRIDGKIVEDRVHAARCEITVGPTLDATFVTAEAPRTLRIFRSTPEKRALELHEGMTGRIASAQGVIDLVEAFHRGVRTIALEDDARGRVQLHGVVLLVQMVEPPPQPTRAQLPLAVRAGSPIDWGFATLAAFSFLAHFAFAAAVDGDWFDPSIDDELETASLVEGAHQRPAIALEEPTTDPVDDTTKTPKQPTTDVKNDVKTDVKNAGVASTKTSGADGKAPSFGETGSKLSDELDSLQFKAISVFDGKAPASAIVLKPGETTADAEMDELAKKKSTITMDDGKLKVSTGTTPGPITGPIGPPTCIYCVAKNDPPTKPPVTAPTDPPQSPIPPPQIPPSTGNVPDADTIVAKNRWRFTACYRKAVNVDPNDGGTIKVLVNVGEGGEVSSASALSTGGASGGLSSCIVSSFYSMKFAAPEGGSGSFSVPVVLRTK